jgi:hypothetical protein
LSKLLESFGFVEIKASGDQKFGLAFLPNPNIVLLNMENKKGQGKGPYDPPGLGGLQDATMSAILERAIDIGANDVTRAHAKINAAKRKADDTENTPAKPVKARPRRIKAAKE